MSTWVWYPEELLAMLWEPCVTLSIPKGKEGRRGIALGVTCTAQEWQLCLLWLTGAEDGFLTHLSHTDTILTGPLSNRDGGNRVELTEEPYSKSLPPPSPPPPPLCVLDVLRNVASPVLRRSESQMSECSSTGTEVTLWQPLPLGRTHLQGA